ncbi:MAG: hypothetical protein EBR65_03555, partial [Actinobacteria bacterium]|nr:hypothetical protein [Actinomycetota bacterium]
QRRLTEAIERARSTIDTIAATVRPTGFDVDLDAPEPEAIVPSGTGAIYDAAADELDDGEMSIPPIVDATAAMEAVERAEPEPSSDDDVSEDGDEGTNVVPLFAGGDQPSGSSVDDIFARLREGEETDPGGDETDPDGEDDSDAESAAFDELVAAASKKVKRVLADEQNAALETLRGKAQVNDVGDLVPTDVEHAATYTSTVTEELDAAAVMGASTVGGSKPAARTLKRIRTEAIESISEGIVAVLRERLGAAVNAAAGDNDEISAKVRAVYREVKTKVIDDRVGDALWQARSAASVAAAPKGTLLRWVVAPGATACPDCEDNSLAAPVTAGEPFPTGHVNGPAHPGCRCRLVPDGR